MIEVVLAGRKCYQHIDPEAEHLLIQPVDEHDLKVLEQEIEGIKSLTNVRFSLVALLIDDWQEELSPWKASAVFKDAAFGDGAKNTLALITEQLLPSLTAKGIYDASRMKLIIGGYSLAGLFALWTAYQTDLFDGIAAVSPSVWFPKWMDYAGENRPLARNIYLSLGDMEEKTKSPVMSQVGNAIRKQHELLTHEGVNTVLEWNPGNHFVDSDKRMAKGFAWTLKETENK